MPKRPTLTLDLTKPGANVSPMLYGLMTEEINHSYDGGLYAELIRNRIFKDNPTKPEGWSLVQEDTVSSKATIKLLQQHRTMFLLMNAVMPSMVHCKLVYGLQLKKQAGRVGIANEGYWGIPVKPSTLLTKHHSI